MGYSWVFPTGGTEVMGFSDVGLKIRLNTYEYWVGLELNDELMGFYGFFISGGQNLSKSLNLLVGRQGIEPWTT